MHVQFTKNNALKQNLTIDIYLHNFTILFSVNQSSIWILKQHFTNCFLKYRKAVWFFVNLLPLSNPTSPGVSRSVCTLVRPVINSGTPSPPFKYLQPCHLRKVNPSRFLSDKLWVGMLQNSWIISLTIYSFRSDPNFRGNFHLTWTF